MALAAPAVTPLCVARWPRASPSSSSSSSSFGEKKRRSVVCNFSHFFDVVRKDMAFLKRGASWASEALHLPKLSKSFEDFIWFRNLENPHSSFGPEPSWPKPYYPGLIGIDLLMADLRAIEAYGIYIHYFLKMLTKPLPEFYDPQEVEDYFRWRPHIVSLRFLEVFASFAFAAIKMRVTWILNEYGPGLEKNVYNSEYYFGQLLKEAMLKLGPTFVKVGQSLSTRPDIIGSDISKALSELHDRIPPFPRALAMKIIEEELGCPVERVFSYISDEPVAAASFGQVYRGRTSDGYDVAVKVQRPSLRHVVVRDIYILRLGLGLLKEVFKRKSDPRLYADELGKGLVGELDYTLEAANATEFKEAHAPFPFIFVPRVFRQLTSKKVLTMEWVVGESPSDLMLASSTSVFDQPSEYLEKRQQLEAKRHLLDLVSKGVEASLIQLLETGLMHADPHPGNVRYTAAGQIGFLDFGLVCRMEKRHQYAILSSIIHIVIGDWAALVRDLVEMDVVRRGTSIRHVTLDLEDALGEVELTDGIPDIKFSRVLGKIWSIALKYHFRMPPYYTLVLRSLASLEGLAVAADENFKTFKAAYPYVVRKLLTDNSVTSRRILHSVVLNRRKELQWKTLLFLLGVGVDRKGFNKGVASVETSLASGPHVHNGVFDVANLVLRLLPSKDGVVLRRLLMTVDGPSLIRAMVSKEATFFRQDICRALADIIYQWMINAFGMRSSQMSVSSVSNDKEVDLSLRLSSYQSVLRDKRLKVIFYRVLGSARREPFLMLRLFWASFVIFLSASALAGHQILVSWSEVVITSALFAPKQFAISA